MVRLFQYAVFVVILTAGSAFAESQDAVEKLQFADGLYSRGMFELAIKEYKDYLSENAKSDTANTVHFRLAECYRQLGQLRTAEKVYRHVYYNHSDSDFRHKAGFRRAELFLKTGQYDGAVTLYKLLLKSKPPEDIASASWYYLGETYIENEQMDDAIKAFETVRKQYASSGFYSYSLIKLGVLFAEKKGSEDKALEMFKLAALKPGDDRIAAESLFQMAEIYFKTKDYKKSADAYGELLKKYPKDQRSSEAELQAAWASHNAGIYTEALRIASLNAVKPGDSAAEWIYLKANCERQLMKSKEAVETYTKLLKEHSKAKFVTAAHYEKALTCYNMGDFESAIADAEEIQGSLKVESSGIAGFQKSMHKDISWLLAESYAALKDEDKAIQYYRLIARDYPESDVADDAAYRLAHNLQEKGSYKEASRYYNMVAVNFPKSELAPKALFASGYCLAKVKMDDEAVRDWALLVKSYPEHGLTEESYYQKAMAEIRLDRSKDALTSLRALLKKYPGSEYLADAHYWTAVMLRKTGKTHDAEAELRLALDAVPRKDLEREVKFQLGLVLQGMKKPNESLKLFQELIDTPLKEKFPLPLLEWMAEQSFSNGSFKEASAVANVMLDGSVDAAWRQIAWCLLGRSEYGQKKMPEAAKAFKTALAERARTPFAAEAALRVGEIELAAQNNKEAAKYFEKSATLAQGDAMVGVRARAYIGLGSVANLDEKYDDAVRYYMSVAVLFDDEALVSECLYKAGEALKKQGKNEAAAKAHEELKERYPDTVWAKKIS